MLLSFWNDECGAIDVSASILFTTIVVLGCLVAVTAVRTNIVQEFGDIANALETLDQSYSYTVNGVASTYADDPGPATNAPGTAPTGLDVAVAGSSIEQ
jgi:Flp pilus assembly pilin Flp